MNTPGVDHHRRSFLKTAGRAGLAAALRRSALVGSGAALLQSGRANAREQELLIQPPQI